MAIARFQWCDTSHPTIDNAGDFVYPYMLMGGIQVP